MISSNISTIDTAIVIAYLLFVLMLGLWISRKTKTGEDLLLGGRSFGWGLIGLSLFASNISSSSIIALSGAAYKYGIVDSVFEFMSGLPLIIAALIFVPIYLKNKITTIPEFLEKRFDYRSQRFFSIITIITTILIETAGALYAGALVIQVFYPGIDLWVSIFGLSLFAGFYTASGGLKAVVITDAIQAVILILGCSTISYLLFEQYDFSWDKFTSAMPEGHMSLVRPIDDPAIPWPGLMIGVPMLGFWYWSTNQYIVQRVLGAKSINHARWGMIFAGFLKIIPLFIMVIPGAMALGLYPGIEETDSVFPMLMSEILPAGALGFVLAGLVSAIMSSVDSALNSSSSLVIVDFIKPLRPKMSETDVLKYSRVCIIIFMVLAACWAPQIGMFKEIGLWGYLQQMFAIFVPPIVVIFLFGVFYKRGNGNGAIAALVVGTLIGIGIFYCNNFTEYNLHFSMSVGIAFILSAMIFIAVSLSTAPPKLANVKGLVHESKNINLGTENLPWYYNYKHQMIALAALIFTILIWLW